MKIKNDDNPIETNKIIYLKVTLTEIILLHNFSSITNKKSLIWYMTYDRNDIVF